MAGSLLLASCCAQAWPQSQAEQNAISLERQGDTIRAEDAWKALSAAQPANPLPFAHLGLLEARQEHYPLAIAFYRKAMALDPAMPRLHFNLGLAYFKAGEYKDALEQLQPLVAEQPQSADEAQRLAILIGMSHYALGQFAAAAHSLQQATDQDPKNLPLLLTLAHSCLLSSQYPCVLNAFHKIVALDAGSAEAHMLAGEALDEMKDTLNAEREFRAAVRANPAEPGVHFGLGYVLWTQGKSEEAAKEFQAELDHDPQNNPAMLYLADSQIQMNRMSDALPLLENAVKVNPENSMGHLDLGIVYADGARNDDALRELKRAIALEPKSVKAHWRLFQLYRSMGRSAEANLELAKSKSIKDAADEGVLKAMAGASPQSSASLPPSSTPAKK